MLRLKVIATLHQLSEPYSWSKYCMISITQHKNWDMHCKETNSKILIITLLD